MTLLFNLLALILSLFLLVKSADYAIHYSTRLAESFRLSKYVIGFLVVAVISILPEAFIAITSAAENMPDFGLGMLFGSNVADLTMVFALVVLLSGRELRAESKIITNRYFHIAAILCPLLLGTNGYYSRVEGAILIAVGLGFYIYVLRNNTYDTETEKTKFRASDLICALASMAALLLGAFLTVRYGVNSAHLLGVSPVLIGMVVVALGTTLPEMMFALRAAKKQHDGLALGDILGTVIADATIVVGTVALIRPFAFNPRIVYLTGVFMLLSALLLFHFMKTGKIITRKEAIWLALFYILFVLTEFFAGKY